MSTRRAGLWLVGALGGVGATVSLGLSALRRALIDDTSLVTAHPALASLDLDGPEHFVVGGHDIRQGTLLQGIRDLHRGANLFSHELIEACAPDLESWQENLRPGTVLNAGAAITRLANLPEATRPLSPRQAIEQIQADLSAFKERHQLDQVVVVHVASTEPPFPLSPEHGSLGQLREVLDRADPHPLPASSLYAWAAADLGMAYVNFTPSLGASFPALLELAQERGAVLAGQDGKTGETLLKTVLAPMFAARRWEILSWVGHNIFGNRDGQILDDPVNKESKIRTKDQVISQIVGYRPQTHVSIEYLPSLSDWKTAWNHIHFRGFLDVKMIMQVTWQGCDSILAAPLVIDLARLALLAQRRGETGVLRYLACFFKNPMEVREHDFFKQLTMLFEHLAPDQEAQASAR